MFLFRRSFTVALLNPATCGDKFSASTMWMCVLLRLELTTFRFWSPFVIYFWRNSRYFRVVVLHCRANITLETSAWLSTTANPSTTQWVQRHCLMESTDMSSDGSTKTIRSALLSIFTLKSTFAWTRIDSRCWRDRVHTQVQSSQSGNRPHQIQISQLHSRQNLNPTSTTNRRQHIRTYTRRKNEFLNPGKSDNKLFTTFSLCYNRKKCYDVKIGCQKQRIGRKLWWKETESCKCGERERDSTRLSSRAKDENDFTFQVKYVIEARIIPLEWINVVSPEWKSEPKASSLSCTQQLIQHFFMDSQFNTSSEALEPSQQRVI